MKSRTSYTCGFPQIFLRETNGDVSRTVQKRRTQFESTNYLHRVEISPTSTSPVPRANKHRNPAFDSWQHLDESELFL